MTPAGAPFAQAWARTCRLSQYVARVSQARPEMAAELAARWDRAFASEQMGAELLQGKGLGDRLRRLRQSVMVHLAHRDLNGLASLDEVVSTMSALADACLAAAAAQAHDQVAAIHGEPAGAGRLIVAALGKLGRRRAQRLLGRGPGLPLRRRTARPTVRERSRTTSSSPRRASGVIALLSEHHRRGPGLPRRHAPAALRRQRARWSPRLPRSRTTSSPRHGRGSAMRG